jgi:hypothetical protein
LTSALSREKEEGYPMESYIVRIYRGEKDNPRSFVGIVEEIGTEEKKAFTNLEELWNILNSIKLKLIKPSTRIHLEKEENKRKESRARKEIPFSFIYKKRKLKAETVNISKHGLGIRINEKISLPVGNITNLQTNGKSEKAKVIWVDGHSRPSVTIAGFHLMDGKLNLKDIQKNMRLLMREDNEASPNRKI